MGVWGLIGPLQTLWVGGVQWRIKWSLTLARVSAIQPYKVPGMKAERVDVFLKACHEGQNFRIKVDYFPSPVNKGKCHFCLNEAVKTIRVLWSRIKESVDGTFRTDPRQHVVDGVWWELTDWTEDVAAGVVPKGSHQSRNHIKLMEISIPGGGRGESTLGSFFVIHTDDDKNDPIRQGTRLSYGMENSINLIFFLLWWLPSAASRRRWRSSRSSRS